MDEPGVLTRRRLALWLLVLCSMVALVGGLLGWLSAEAPEAFDWGHALEAAIAAGTVALAAFTGALAFTTSGDVRATWKLAELARADQDSRTTPVVVLAPSGFGGSLRDGAQQGADGAKLHHLRLEVRNVGLGPALEIRISGRYSTPTDGYEIRFQTRTLPALGAGQRLDWALFVENPPHPDWDAEIPWAPGRLEITAECKNMRGDAGPAAVVIPHTPVPS